MEVKIHQIKEGIEQLINMKENNTLDLENIKDINNDKIIDTNEKRIRNEKEDNKKEIHWNEKGEIEDENIMEDMKTEVDENNVFYERGKEYWKGVEASVDGMLGGLGHVSGVDLAESCKFLRQFIKVGSMQEFFVYNALY